MQECATTPRIFALTVGIDQYKSGSIWNLESCVDDAKSISRWLRHDLGVPKNHVCLLLDKQATAQNVVDSFMSHLVKNPVIERGDPILIYWAGHGSVIGRTQLLCTYDHLNTCDAGKKRRVSGISNHIMHGLITELAKEKGNNITLILDCCFSPVQSPSNIRDRSHTRATPAGKVTVSDLWPSPSQMPLEKAGVSGFYDPSSATHTLLAACSPGEKAVESKEGGKFTSALLNVVRDVPLHRTANTTLMSRIRAKMKEGQTPLCLGHHADRIVFNAVPDDRYAMVEALDMETVRIGIGKTAGIVEGSELSVHSHNYCRSVNPVIATIAVDEVHPTWSIGHTNRHVPNKCWALVSRLNISRVHCVKSQKSFTSLFRKK